MSRHAIQVEGKPGTKLYKVAERISPAGRRASDDGFANALAPLPRGVWAESTDFCHAHKYISVYVYLL